MFGATHPPLHTSLEVSRYNSYSGKPPSQAFRAVRLIWTNNTHLLNPFLLPLRCRCCFLFFFYILIILQMVGLLGRVISSSQGLYLNTGQHKNRINIYTYQTSIPFVGFKLTIPASERGKTVHVLDRSATVTGGE
jgi:hypothetical protein